MPSRPSVALPLPFKVLTCVSRAACSSLVANVLESSDLFLSDLQLLEPLQPDPSHRPNYPWTIHGACCSHGHPFACDHLVWDMQGASYHPSIDHGHRHERRSNIMAATCRCQPMVHNPLSAPARSATRLYTLSPEELVHIHPTTDVQKAGSCARIQPSPLAAQRTRSLWGEAALPTRKHARDLAAHVERNDVSLAGSRQ